VTAAEIVETAKELAALIGEPVPQIANEEELRDYWEHVEIYLGLKSGDLYLIRTAMRRRFEPPDIDAMLLDRKQGSEFLKSFGYAVAPRTLAKFACVGGGPAFRHFGRRVRYERPTLLAWAEGRLSPPRTSTSVPAGQASCETAHGVDRE
jgi:hypothetical protein